VLARRDQKPDQDRHAIERLRDILLASGSSDFFQVEFPWDGAWQGRVVSSPPLPIGVASIRSWEQRGWCACEKRWTAPSGTHVRLYEVREWGYEALEEMK